MEPAEKCAKCGAAVGKLDAQVCGRCGWDSQVGMRKCVKCKNALVLDEKLGYGPVGGLAGVVGFVFWYFFGLFLGGAIASAVGALCGLITAVTLRVACSDCGKEAEPRLLDAEEKEACRKRRLGFGIGAIGLGLLSLLLLFAWVFFMKSRFHGA